MIYAMAISQSVFLQTVALTTWHSSLNLDTMNLLIPSDYNFRLVQFILRVD